MKATKTQKEVTRTITEKQPVYTLELSHAEAMALYELTSVPVHAFEKYRTLEQITPGGDPSVASTIDWLIHHAIADLVEPSQEDES